MPSRSASGTWVAGKRMQWILFSAGRLISLLRANCLPVASQYSGDLIANNADK